MTRNRKQPSITWAILLNSLFLMGVICGTILSVGTASVLYYVFDVNAAYPGAAAMTVRDYWFLIVPACFFLLLGLTRPVKKSISKIWEQIYNLAN